MRPRSSIVSNRGQHPILIAVMLLGAFAAGFLVWTLLRTKTGKTLRANLTKTFTNSASTTNTPVVVPAVQETNDTDRDGLTDEEERQAGTTADSSDTDADGLSDGAEVHVYRTDPKNPDADGNGKNDGAEVRAGDNPAGEGKLLDLQRELERTGVSP